MLGLFILDTLGVLIFNEDKVRIIKMGSQLLGGMLYVGRIKVEFSVLTSAVQSVLFFFDYYLLRANYTVRYGVVRSSAVTLI